MAFSAPIPVARRGPYLKGGGYTSLPPVWAISKRFPDALYSLLLLPIQKGSRTIFARPIVAGNRPLLLLPNVVEEYQLKDKREKHLFETRALLFRLVKGKEVLKRVEPVRREFASVLTEEMETSEATRRLEVDIYELEDYLFKEGGGSDLAILYIWLRDGQVEKLELLYPSPVPRYAASEEKVKEKVAELLEKEFGWKVTPEMMTFVNLYEPFYHLTPLKVVFHSKRARAGLLLKPGEGAVIVPPMNLKVFGKSREEGYWWYTRSSDDIGAADDAVVASAIRFPSTHFIVFGRLGEETVPLCWRLSSPELPPDLIEELREKKAPLELIKYTSALLETLGPEWPLPVKV